MLTQRPLRRALLPGSPPLSAILYARDSKALSVTFTASFISRTKKARRPSTVRKELKCLHKLADDLIAGLTNLDSTALMAMHTLPPGESLLTYDFFAEFERWRSETDRIRECLAGAVERMPKGKRGPDDTLPRFVAAINSFLVSVTGHGLVRASEPSKGRRGRASNHRKFVMQLVQLIGLMASEGAVDDAIKKAIAGRHAVRGA